MTTQTTSPPCLHERHPPMSATATLTNCYVPLSIPPSSSSPESSTSAFDPFSRVTHDYDDHVNIVNTLNSDDGKDSDGKETKEKSKTNTRGPRSLRRIHLARSILSQSTGSALVEWGHTKLVVSVRGPRPVNCSSLNAASSGGGLVCEVRYLPHIGIRMETLASNALSHDFSSKTTHGNSGTSGNSGSSGSSSGGVYTGTRIPRDTLSTSQDTALLSSGGSPCAPSAFSDETYLSNRLYDALSPAVILDGLLSGKNGGNGGSMCVEVFVQVLQSDGGVLGAAVVGASLALVDAGVGMRDVVCASSAAVVKGVKSVNESNGDVKEKKKVVYHAIADPTEDEILEASGVVTIAMMPNWREVTVWDQFGKMSLESSSEAMELARDGCVTMHKFLKNCLAGSNAKR